MERKGKEGLRDVRKFRKNGKSNKNFSSDVKILSNKYGKNSKNNKFHKILHLERNKYGKNSKNNKFHKILHLERGKVKKGFRKSTNFAKIAKVTRSFPAM